MGETRSQWGSRMAFVLAAAGSAIGLGNLWKFPYMAGVQGGGAFVIIYLACVAVVGIPIFISELYIGQQAQSNTVEAFELTHRKQTFWRLPGWIGLTCAFLILSFYGVVSGWILDFEFRAIMGEFSRQDSAAAESALTSLFASPGRQAFWFFIFLLLSSAIVRGGVEKGLEKWNKILMPSLLAILVGLLVYSFSMEGFGKALDFLLLAPDFSKLTASSILEAVGHSFFTLSLGMGVIMIYGSYLSQNESLPKVAIMVAFLDTAIAMIAGLIIFTVVFSFGLEPSKGPGLILVTLPSLFGKMPGGYFISIVFFILVVFAALTSAISILEVIVAYGTEKFNLDRRAIIVYSFFLVYAVGLLTVFSTNHMSEIKVFGLTAFDFLDKLTTSYLLPAGGLLTSLFFGWVLGQKAVQKVFGHVTEPSLKSPLEFWLKWSARLLAPVAVVWIMYGEIFG